MRRKNRPEKRSGTGQSRIELMQKGAPMKPWNPFSPPLTRRRFGQAALFSPVSESVPLLAQPPSVSPASVNFLGNLKPILASIQEETGFPMHYAQRNRLSLEVRRRRGRAAVGPTPAYAP